MGASFFCPYTSASCYLLCTNNSPYLCSLPWQGLKAGTKKMKYEKISERKIATSVEVISLLKIQSSLLSNWRLLQFFLFAGSLSWIPFWISMLLPSLPCVTLWWWSWLSIPEETVQRPFYSRGLIFMTWLLLFLNILFQEMLHWRSF